MYRLVPSSKVSSVSLDKNDGNATRFESPAMSTQLSAIHGLKAHSGDAIQRERYLFGPRVDFICLGGGSLMVIALVALFHPMMHTPPPHRLLLVVLFTATILNFPHFVHSYQIFYARFGTKIALEGGALRRRYVFAGIIVPIVLLAAIAAAIGLEAPIGIAVLGSLFVFLTGWHYVKQGYGLLIVDSVLKRSFFQTWEKWLLVANCYAVWLSYWCIYNDGFGSNEVFSKLIVLIHVPEILVRASLLVSGVLLVAILTMFGRRIVRGEPVPVLGALSYFTTLYIWLFLLLDPWFLLIVPAFHSLQYLVVVWRYKLSELSARCGSRMRAFSGFLAFGFFVGIAAFIIVPVFLDSFVDYGGTALGSGIFLFFFVVFINIHHYFLDNVMWRRENPDVRRYLMATS
ncbi:MAG: hypothetical protein ACLQDC_15995 [Verrucomicrobiia bacterium]